MRLFIWFLLVPERHHRIDGRSTPGWSDAGDYGHQNQNQRRRKQSYRIARTAPRPRPDDPTQHYAEPKPDHDTCSKHYGGETASQPRDERPSDGEAHP